MSDISLEQFVADHEVLYSMVTSGALWFMGDVLAQLIEAYTVKAQPVLPSSPSSSASSSLSLSSVASGGGGGGFMASYQPLRSLRLAFFAAFVWAPATFFWFRFLEWAFPGEGLLVALKRMAVDQTLYAPLVILSLFVVVASLEGRTVPGIVRKVREAFLPTLLRNWMLWPLAQTALQGFVPLQSRIFLANLINLPWTAYLAYAAASQHHSKNAGALDDGAGKKGRRAGAAQEAEDELQPMAVR